jgi:hypothetical protein
MENANINNHMNSKVHSKIQIVKLKYSMTKCHNFKRRGNEVSTSMYNLYK